MLYWYILFRMPNEKGPPSWSLKRLRHVMRPEPTDANLPEIEELRVKNGAAPQNPLPPSDLPIPSVNDLVELTQRPTGNIPASEQLPNIDPAISQSTRRHIEWGHIGIALGRIARRMFWFRF